MSPNWISLLGGGGRERGDAFGLAFWRPAKPLPAASPPVLSLGADWPSPPGSLPGLAAPQASAHPRLPRGREGVSAFRQTPPTPRDPLLTDLSSTRCSCWGWRPMRSLTVVPGLRLQYSWNTSRRLALLCPVCVCVGGGPGSARQMAPALPEAASPKPTATLLGHIGQALLLQGLVIHQVLDLGRGAVHVGVLQGARQEAQEPERGAG